MDLRDLIKLAGLSDVELLNRLQPSVEEADGAGFDTVTTEPEEEIYDDPMSSAGSTVDLSLRRYLKAKGDHVTVDENVYPDYTVEDVNEAYAAFKEGKYKSDAQRKAVHAAKAKESIEEATVNEEKRYQIRYLPYDSDKFKIVKGFTSKEEAEKYAKAENFDELADEWNIEEMNEAKVDDDRDELTKKLFPRRSRDDMEKSDRERNRAMNAKRFMKSGKPSRSREWGAYESVSEAEEGTYMKQWYNYSEDFAMLELYVDGKLVDSWSDYFGANETGNPLQAKFIEMAKENGIDPVGLKVVDGSDGDEGVFTSNGIKWNSNEVAESLNDIRKLAGIAKELIDEGKMSDQIIRDSETMSKEEFTKKYGKEMADEYFESVANEGRFKDMYIELEDLEPAIMHLKTKYMDQGMEPEEAQDMACETLGCDPEMFDEYLTMKFNESTLDEAEIELAPGYTIKTDNPGIYKGTKTTSGFVGGQSGEAMYMANRVLDAIEEQDPSSSEEVFALARKFCKEMGCTDDAKKRVYKQLAKMGWTESLEEADIDENAFNQAAAAAARANKDSFEFNGKTYKTKMDKSTAHKLDDDVEMLRKLAGLV